MAEPLGIGGTIGVVPRPFCFSFVGWVRVISPYVLSAAGLSIACVFFFLVAYVTFLQDPSGSDRVSAETQSWQELIACKTLRVSLMLSS